MLYVRREAKPSHHGGTKQKNVFVGRFCSIESARLATTVRFYIEMDDGVRPRLVDFLAKKEANEAKGAKNLQPRECSLARLV